ncbi:MAG: adenylate/guanylate cyclase domain-containing protein [Gaiellaceae bacterium]
MQICPSCGEENPARFRLCGFCATPLASAQIRHEVRKVVTVVFCDLKGSTSLGEALDSESLREVMSRYFDEMRGILEHHGGTVEKYIGDAIMAVFGLPRIHEDDALRAVRAVHAMQEALATLNEELEQRWGVRLANRTGVNTGEVVAGDPTTGQRLVTGDTVNVAARLEQAAPALEVLIGEPTHRLVRGAVEVEAVEPLELKGKSERVPAYRLVSVLAGDEAALRRREVPIIGRETELTSIVELFDRVVDERRCRTVTLLGDAGVGKSRLGEEVLVHVSPSATIIRGRCLPYGDGITFWPLVEAVREAAGISDRDQVESARRKLAELAAPGNEDVVARVAAAVGLSDAQFPVPELFWGVRRLFELLAERRALVVVIEDLHWAEGTFLDLIEYLGTALDAAPVLLLCNARPALVEYRPAWATASNAACFELGPLGAADSARVVENLLGDAELEPAVRTRIVEASEGNPFFVEQLLSMMIDEGLIELQDGHWRAPGNLPLTTIPPTIQALLAARLDLLDHEERVVIEAASVAGYVFPEDAIRHLVPDVLRDRVGDKLAALNRKQLVRPDPAERSIEEAHRFLHALIRDTTYGGLLKRGRATLHEEFVRWADRVNGDRAREYEEILGYHLEQAHRYLAALGPLDEHGWAVGADAARRLSSAGARARNRGDLSAAANLLERAAALLPQLDRTRLALLPDLGSLLIDLGRYDDARAVLGDSIAAAREVEDRCLGAEATLFNLLLQLRAGETEQWIERAVPQIEVAIDVFTEAGEDVRLAKAHLVLAYVHGTACRYGEAADACARGLEHARRAGSGPEQRANATSYALAACWGPTPIEEAVEHCETILAQVSENRLSAAWVVCLLGHLRAMQGDFEQGRQLLQESRSLIEELGGQTWHLAWTSLSAARIEMLAGDPGRAEVALSDAAESLDQMGERYLLSTVTAMLARAVYAQDRLDEAIALTQRAQELAGEDDVETQALWRSVRAKSFARYGRFDEAKMLVQDALQMVLATDSSVMKVEALVDLGEVLRELGDDTAAWAFREALQLAERKGNLVAAAEARTQLGRLQEQPAEAG